MNVTGFCGSQTCSPTLAASHPKLDVNEKGSVERKSDGIILVDWSYKRVSKSEFSNHGELAFCFCLNHKIKRLLSL